MFLTAKKHSLVDILLHRVWNLVSGGSVLDRVDAVKCLFVCAGVDIDIKI